MKYYLAPMEGYTGYIVRNAIEEFFPGADKYFTPFLPASEKLGNKYLRDIDPANNRVKELVPQVMANKVSEVLRFYEQIKEYGYDTININLGCPSGTVVSKNRGSGFLRQPEELDRFLYETFEAAPCKISIKTRIGFFETDEWPELLDIYKKYPMTELIIHPRVQKELYKGKAHRDAFALAYREIKDIPLCYNGDLCTCSDIASIEADFPDSTSIMIGRGLFANPGLFLYYKNPESYDEADYRRRLASFHDRIYENYCEAFSGEGDVIMHMKALWGYLGESFTDSDKDLKKLKKAKNPAEYRSIASHIISNGYLEACKIYSKN